MRCYLSITTCRKAKHRKAHPGATEATFQHLQLAIQNVRRPHSAQSSLLNLQTGRNRFSLPGGRSQPVLLIIATSSSSPPRHNSRTKQAQDSEGGTNEKSYRYRRIPGSLAPQFRTRTRDQISQQHQEGHFSS